MKQRSSIAALLLSLFVPFYILYWYYDVARDMKARGGNPPKFWYLFAPLFAGLLAVLFAIVGAGATSGSSTKEMFNIISLLLGLLVIASIVFPFIYQWRFSTTAEQVTGGKVSKGVAFLLFIFFAPVSVYLIQDALNTASPGTSGQSGQLPINPTPPTSIAPDGSTPPTIPTPPVSPAA